MILLFVLLALFSIPSVLSMRVSTVCARGSYGFDVNASNGKIGIILAGTNFQDLRTTVTQVTILRGEFNFWLI